MSLNNTRQLRIREILLESCQIYRAKVATLLPFALFSFLPLFLVKWFGLLEPIRPNLGDFYYMVLSQVFIFLLTLLNLIPNMAVAYIVQETIGGRKVGFTSSFRFAISLWGAAVLTCLLMELMLLGLVFLLVIPAIIWGNYYSFYINAIANRGLKYRAALDYSKDLVKGRWWKIYGTSLALGFAIIIPTLIVSFILSRFIPNPLISVILDLINCLSINFLMVTYSIWFLNLDAIKHPLPEVYIDPEDGSPVNVPESVFF
jgi:hypothetical protein